MQNLTGSQIIARLNKIISPNGRYPVEVESDGTSAVLLLGEAAKGMVMAPAPTPAPAPKPTPPPPAAAQPYPPRPATRSAIHALIENEARVAHPTLSLSEAVSTYVETPAGRQRYQQYRDAPLDDWRPVPPAPVAQTPRAKAWAAIEQQAVTLAERTPGLSREAASERVVRENPELYHRYRLASPY